MFLFTNRRRNLSNNFNEFLVNFINVKVKQFYLKIDILRQPHHFHVTFSLCRRGAIYKHSHTQRGNRQEQCTSTASNDKVILSDENHFVFPSKNFREENPIYLFIAFAAKRVHWNIFFPAAMFMNEIAFTLTDCIFSSFHTKQGFYEDIIAVAK